jgi:hypothetical protein
MSRLSATLCNEASRHTVIASLLDQPLQQVLHPHHPITHAATPVQRRRDLFGQVLADTFGAAAPASDAGGIGGRSEDAFHLPPLALPAAASSFADFPSFRLGFGIVSVAPSSHCIHVQQRTAYGGGSGLSSWMAPNVAPTAWVRRMQGLECNNAGAAEEMKDTDNSKGD